MYVYNRMCKMIFECQLAVILILGKLFVSGEWIEMPQFSDESKIYKLSPHKHTAFYNEFPNNYDTTWPEYETKITGDFSHEFDNIQMNNGTNGVISYNTKERGGEEEEEVSSQSAQLTTIDYPRNLYERFAFDSDDDPMNVSEQTIDAIKSDFEEIPPRTTDSSTSASSVLLELPIEGLSSASTTVEPILANPVLRDSSSEKVNYRNRTIADYVKVENYLPMEMLKKVHQTLKSQSTTLNRKMKFLKRFEKDLISEIEKRLSIALAPTRQTRGTHDYYDHDEEIGFPSLEGALMSISFLTFAVYLVRLVMLLFRNPNPSTAATIFFGRNRRSTDVPMNDNSEEILNYLNTFDAY